MSWGGGAILFRWGVGSPPSPQFYSAGGRWGGTPRGGLYQGPCAWIEPLSGWENQNLSKMKKQTEKTIIYIYYIYMTSVRDTVPRTGRIPQKNHTKSKCSLVSSGTCKWALQFVCKLLSTRTCTSFRVRESESIKKNKQNVNIYIYIHSIFIWPV